MSLFSSRLTRDRIHGRIGTLFGLVHVGTHYVLETYNTGLEPSVRLGVERLVQIGPHWEFVVHFGMQRCEPRSQTFLALC